MTKTKPHIVPLWTAIDPSCHARPPTLFRLPGGTNISNTQIGQRGQTYGALFQPLPSSLAEVDCMQNRATDSPSIVVSGVRYLDATIADHSLSWLHLGKNWAQLKGAATRLLLAKLDPTTSVVDTWRSMMCMAYTWHRWRKWKIKSGRVAIHSIPSNARSAGRIPHDASALT